MLRISFLTNQCFYQHLDYRFLHLEILRRFLFLHFLNCKNSNFTRALKTGFRIEFSFTFARGREGRFFTTEEDRMTEVSPTKTLVFRFGDSPLKRLLW